MKKPPKREKEFEGQILLLEKIKGMKSQETVWEDEETRQLALGNVFYEFKAGQKKMTDRI